MFVVVPKMVLRRSLVGYVGSGSVMPVAGMILRSCECGVLALAVGMEVEAKGMLAAAEQMATMT